MRWLDDDLLSGPVARLLGEPHFLIFFVTSRCEFHCKDCLVHGLHEPAGRSDELTLREIEAIAGNLPRLGMLSLTGGEPFVREDLGEIARVLAASGKIRHLVIVTNGWHTERILQTARGLRSSGIRRLSIRVSLQGPREIHDAICGVEGAYEHAVETLRRLVALRVPSGRLQVGSITTLHEDNVAALPGFLPFLQSLQLDTLSLNVLRHARPGGGRTALDPGQVALLRSFHGANPSAFRRAYKSIVLGLQTGELDAPCQAGRLVAVLRENGDLYPCELLPRRMASLRDHDFDLARVWRSSEARAVREFANRHCPSCTFECVIPLNLVCVPGLLARLGLRLIDEAIISKLFCSRRV